MEAAASASRVQWSRSGTGTSDVRLKRESPAEFYFANQRAAAAVIVVGCLTFPALMARSPRHTPTFFYCLLALFPLLGTIALWWRDELRLDLVSRQYTRRRGFWPSVRVRRGSLDELDAVVLARYEYLSTNNGGGMEECPTWEVSLAFRGWDRTISILATRNENEAHQRFEHFAKRLGVRAIDRSGPTERVMDATGLDHPVAAQLDRAEPGVDPSSPPPGSGIEVTGPRGERVIVLPRVPFQPAGLFLVLFGTAFGGFALVALAAALGAVSMKVSGSRVGLGVIASIFTLIGLGIAALPFLAASAREEVREAGDDVVFSTRLLGRRVGVKRIARREIEEIDVRRDAQPHQVRAGVTAKEEVFVRSDRTIARIGRELTPDAKRWLRDALLTMARG